MDPEVMQAIQDVYKKIDSLDRKYDKKNDKAVEQFTAVRTDINSFSGPVAAMAVQVESNRVSADDAEDAIEKFKSKLLWTLVGVVLSFLSSLIMFILALAAGV